MIKIQPKELFIEHTGNLEDHVETPPSLMEMNEPGQGRSGVYSCNFCGVGDSGFVISKSVSTTTTSPDLETGKVLFKFIYNNKPEEYHGEVFHGGLVEVQSTYLLTSPGRMISAILKTDKREEKVLLRDVGKINDEEGLLKAQRFIRFVPEVTVSDSKIAHTTPTKGCVKLKYSLVLQPPCFPIQVAPSELDSESEVRKIISYKDSLTKFAKLLLDHRPPKGKTLIYACGQLDYFAIFAMQEVFRLLGVRNLTGNAEHCLNAGASHNEMLTGQEGPFLTIDQSVNGENRLFLFNGWNGLITHPPVFSSIVRKPDFDGYIFEVMLSESAKAVQQKLGDERVILVRPGSDPYFALAVAQEIFNNYPQAIHQKFIEQFCDQSTFDQFKLQATLSQYAAEVVAKNIAPEACFEERIVNAIKDIARKLADPKIVPINIPSVGLSQTSGVVTHALWGNIMGMLGKYGLNPDSSVAGGTLRIPGQINAESEVQGLSRKYFFGRIKIEDDIQRIDAARRMGLPDDAYDLLLKDEPRAALDYSKPTPGEKELFLFFGTHYESNMMGRDRWVEKLTSKDTKIVVVDPITDPFSIKHADLMIPSPPHNCTPKLYQNGEWKLSISAPQKVAPKETRSDATIIYDVMEEIVRLLKTDTDLQNEHPDLKKLLESGYLENRFCSPPEVDRPVSGPFHSTIVNNGLQRGDGEVNRVKLWKRIEAYQTGAANTLGHLYCRFEDKDGEYIQWNDLLQNGSKVYGGVGETRYVLKYDDANHFPFGDIYRNRRPFTFFSPKKEDMVFPDWVVLNSGRSQLSDDKSRLRYSISTFNSGKGTPRTNMPRSNPVYVSLLLAKQYSLETGDKVKVFNVKNDKSSIESEVVVTDRLPGVLAYRSFHKSLDEIENGDFLNTVSEHEERCNYSGQTKVKLTTVIIEKLTKKVEEPKNVIGKGELANYPDLMNSEEEMPLWSGKETRVEIKNIIKETHDVTTFRLQGDPLCRFSYLPGQYCTLKLQIDGKKVMRSYTIASSPSRPYSLDVTIKRVSGGLVSNWALDHLKIGDKIDIIGPRGKFYLTPKKVPAKILFIAGGSGITPIMSMTRWLHDVGSQVDMVFLNCIRGKKDYIFEKELDMYTDLHDNFRPVIGVGSREDDLDGGSSFHGRISQEVLQKAVPDFMDREMYMCGPTGFMDAVKKILKDLSFDMSKMHSESFGGVRKKVDLDTSARPNPVPTPPREEFEVKFQKSNLLARAGADKTILDICENNDIELNYACRSGSCGECKVKLISGEIEHECDDALEDDDKANNTILACTARMKKNCVIDI